MSRVRDHESAPPSGPHHHILQTTLDQFWSRCTVQEYYHLGEKRLLRHGKQEKTTIFTGKIVSFTLDVLSKKRKQQSEKTTGLISIDEMDPTLSVTTISPPVFISMSRVSSLGVGVDFGTSSISPSYDRKSVPTVVVRVVPPEKGRRELDGSSNIPSWTSDTE